MNTSTWNRWLARLFKQHVRTRQSHQRRLVLEFLEDRLAPATNSWIGGGVNTLWSNTANWSLGHAPVAGEDLSFSSLAPAATRNTTDDLAGNPTFLSLTISSSGYTLAQSLTTQSI